jgi:pseudouridine-5'-phosphate glycosidase
MRTVAFAVHDAPFATGSIVAEVIMAGMLVAAAIVLPNTSEGGVGEVHKGRDTRHGS